MSQNKKYKSVLEKYKGMSFSEAANQIGKKYKYRDVDTLQKAAYNEELKALQREQEKRKMMQEVSNVFKMGMGGKLKYDNGGNPLEDIIMNPTGQRSDFAYTTPKYIPNKLETIKLSPLTPTFDENNPPSDLIKPTSLDSAKNFNSSSLQDKESDGVSAYLPSIIGQGLSTAINAGILGGGYDKFNPIDNPNTSRIENLMAERGIDYTAARNDIISGFNAARANNQRAGSANVANALDTNSLNITQNNLEKLSMDQQLANNQFKGDLASTLNSLGQQSVNASNIARNLNVGSKSNFQSELSKFGVSLADSGKFFTRNQLNQNVQNTVIDMLNLKYANFGINKEVANRIVEGKATDEDILALKKAVGDNAASNIIEGFKAK